MEARSLFDVSHSSNTTSGRIAIRQQTCVLGPFVAADAHSLQEWSSVKLGLTDRTG